MLWMSGIRLDTSVNVSIAFFYFQKAFFIVSRFILFLVTWYKYDIKIHRTVWFLNIRHLLHGPVRLSIKGKIHQMYGKFIVISGMESGNGRRTFWLPLLLREVALHENKIDYNCLIIWIIYITDLRYFISSPTWAIFVW